MNNNVFLCYSRKDKAIASQICNEFDRARIPYTSRDVIEPGKTKYAIGDCCIFLWIANKESFETDYVKDKRFFLSDNLRPVCEYHR